MQENHRIAIGLIWPVEPVFERKVVPQRALALWKNLALHCFFQHACTACCNDIDGLRLLWRGHHGLQLLPTGGRASFTGNRKRINRVRRGRYAGFSQSMMIRALAG